MIKTDLTRRIVLDRASRATLGGNVGTFEQAGLRISGTGIAAR